jgi:hypothetical protein
MNSLLKVALIGGGVYFLFRDQINALFTGSPVDDTTTTTTDLTPSPEAQTLAHVRDLMRQAAQHNAQFAGGLANWDMWNFYYRQFRGQDAPVFEVMFPAESDRNRRMSLDEFFAAATAPPGLSGVPFSAARQAWGY